MSKAPMKHLIVIVPGITGSVLQKNGKEVWNRSPAAVAHALADTEKLVSELKLPEDDLTQEIVGGVAATGLIQGVTIVPGLITLGGYTQLADTLVSELQVTRGLPDSPYPLNLLEFPYDWRRSNVFTAGRLKRTIDRHLARWREFSGASDAKVILIGHSMGGLVSRYYLEVLEGWKDCHSLITMGTPHLGSLDAVDSLSNGLKKGPLDLTELARSCPSLYELLPTYPVVMAGSGPAQLSALPGAPGLNMTWVANARSFHKTIHDHAGTRLNQGSLSYTFIPIVGVCQPTLQSVNVVDGHLEVLRTLPNSVDPLLDLGDGTVPRCSAVPPEFLHAPQIRYVGEKHGSLPSNKWVLEELLYYLRTLSAMGPVSFGIGDGDTAFLGVDMRDVCRADEGLEISVTIVNGADDMMVEAILTSKEGTVPARTVRLERVSDHHRAIVEKLSPGVWQVDVRVPVQGRNLPTPVRDHCLVY